VNQQVFFCKMMMRTTCSSLATWLNYKHLTFIIGFIKNVSNLGCNGNGKLIFDFEDSEILTQWFTYLFSVMFWLNIVQIYNCIFLMFPLNIIMEIYSKFSIILKVFRWVFLLLSAIIEFSLSIMHISYNLFANLVREYRQT
jgi:hypothetical protein